MIVVDPNNPKGIVWLASYPKSGNTWVRIFLHALHETITGNRPEKIDINSLGKFSVSNHDPEHFLLYVGRAVSTLTLEEIAELRPKVQFNLMEQADGLVPMKTHSAQMMIDGHAAINKSASAGAVYIVRNPLDVAISLSTYRNISIAQAITEMETSMLAHVSKALTPFVTGSWTEHVKSWTAPPKDPVLIVRYEDMLDDPTETFGKLARHVLMQPNDEQLAAAVELASFSRVQAAEKETGFTERVRDDALFFREGKAGQWREKLTPAQIDRIVEAHGEQMGRFDYLP